MFRRRKQRALVIARGQGEVLIRAGIGSQFRVDACGSWPHTLPIHSYDVALVQLCVPPLRNECGDSDQREDDAVMQEMLRQVEHSLLIIARIRALNPACAILAITHSDLIGDAKRALEAGADWHQSIDWTNSPPSFLLGQIAHALKRRQELSAVS